MSSALPNADAMLRGLMPAVLEAARLEMKHFTAGVIIERKADKSPVTIADREAEAIILAALGQVAPHIAIVAEEAAANGLLPAPADRFFLVDALDGTHLFIKGRPEFSINIALVEDKKATFGLIFSPATGRLYVTRADGRAYTTLVPLNATGAQLDELAYEQLSARPADMKNLVAFNSRASGGVSADLLRALGVSEARPMGSSLKFCLLAAGEGDLYARLGDTYEWDTAAGQAILEAAGGSVTLLDGQPLSYGHAGRQYLNPHFIAWGRTPLIDRLVPAKP